MFGEKGGGQKRVYSGQLTGGRGEPGTLRHGDTEARRHEDRDRGEIRDAETLRRLERETPRSPCLSVSVSVLRGADAVGFEKCDDAFATVPDAGLGSPNFIGL
jgi:hypothetical protein